MKLNLLGRVRNTRLSHANALLPLFEAVINSIHAIEELGPVGLGEISVVIERAKTQQMKIGGWPILSRFLRKGGESMLSPSWAF